MKGYVRQGHAGLFLTRVSDVQCPRVEQCGYRCEAGRGGHDGPHLFEEHKHPSIEATPSPLDVGIARIVNAAIDLDGLWTTTETDDETIVWDVEAGPALDDLRTAIISADFDLLNRYAALTKPDPKP